MIEQKSEDYWLGYYDGMHGIKKPKEVSEP